MTKAAEMANLTKESSYKKYETAINKALCWIKSNAQQGLNSCTLKYTDFPEARNSAFRLWFIAEEFELREYNTNSITIIW